MGESKQPVVYVVRQLRIPARDGDDGAFGYFVSKAYLQRAIIDYSISGDKEFHYFVDFNIYPEISVKDYYELIHVENGDCKRKSEIFKDYKSCKKYVEELNNDIFENSLDCISAEYCNKGYIEENNYKICECAKLLEEKYIPIEERQSQESEAILSKT